MFSGVMALCERSLRVDARAWGPHLARFGLMIGILAAVWITRYSMAFVGAPGLRFYQSILYLNLFFMTLLGIAFFSTVITEEKEEDTLGLMLMAGISPLGILLGKSTGPLIQAMLLVAVQYPFTLLTITMGGITQDQIRSGYTAMLAYLMMLSGIGQFCSTISSRNRSAAFRMTVYLCCYFLVPGLCRAIMSTTGPANLPRWIYDWVGESCIYLQIGAILSSTSNEGILTYQVLTNSVIGLMGHVLSWMSFNQTARMPSTEAAPRGFLTKNRGPLRWMSPGRPRIEPLLWKDFHFIAGGVPGVLIRCAAFTLLYLVAVAIVTSWGRPLSFESQEITTMYLIMLSFAITIDAGLVAARLFHDEIRGQTLSALMMLPRPTGLVLYPKMLGAFLAWLPGILFLFGGFILLPHGLEGGRRFFERPGPALLFTSFYILVPHAAAVAALYVRWGAFPAGVALTAAVGFLTASFINVFRIGPHDAIVYLIALTIYGLCLVCHLIIWLKVERVSSR